MLRYIAHRLLLMIPTLLGAGLLGEARHAPALVGLVLLLCGIGLRLRTADERF